MVSNEDLAHAIATGRAERAEPIGRSAERSAKTRLTVDITLRTRQQLGALVGEMASRLGRPSVPMMTLAQELLAIVLDEEHELAVPLRRAVVERLRRAR